MLDHTLAPELQELSEHARRVGRAAASDLAVREDSWLVGTSREFSRELAEHGWLGMTWPTEEGGGGRSPLERFVVFEALISEGAPVATSWIATSWPTVKSVTCRIATSRAACHPTCTGGTSARTRSSTG